MVSEEQCPQPEAPPKQTLAGPCAPRPPPQLVLVQVVDGQHPPPLSQSLLLLFPFCLPLPTFPLCLEWVTSRGIELEKTSSTPQSPKTQWAARQGLQKDQVLFCFFLQNPHGDSLGSSGKLRQGQGGSFRPPLPLLASLPHLAPGSLLLPGPIPTRQQGAVPPPGSPQSCEEEAGLRFWYPPGLAKPGHHDRKAQRERPRPRQGHRERQAPGGDEEETRGEEEMGQRLTAGRPAHWDPSPGGGQELPRRGGSEAGWHGHHGGRGRAAGLVLSWRPWKPKEMFPPSLAQRKSSLCSPSSLENGIAGRCRAQKLGTGVSSRE